MERSHPNRSFRRWLFEFLVGGWLVLLGLLWISGCTDGQDLVSSQEQHEAEGVPTVEEVEGATPPTQTAEAQPMPLETPPSTDCGFDASQLPEPFVTAASFDQAIWVFLMQGGNALELEGHLETTCGSVWGFAPEPVLAQVVEADLNQDGRMDVILSLTLPYGKGLGEAHVFGYTYGGGGLGYHLLFRRAGAGSRAEGLYSGGGGEILIVEDLNLNGVPEVVFMVNWDVQSELYVVEMAGMDFRPLIEEYSEIEMVTRSHLTLYGSQVEVEDVDEDGTGELLIRTGLKSPGQFTGDPLERTEIWAWDGELFSQRETTYNPSPSYRFEAFLLGDFAFGEGDIDLAVAFYQQSVFDEALLGWSEGHDPGLGPPASPNPAERSRINGYGRYRILLSHAYRGYDVEAEIVFDGLVDQIGPGSGGSPYVELGRVFWDAYRQDGNYYNACSAAIRHAELHSQELLPLLGAGFYGEYGVDMTPQDLCPYPRQG